VRDTFVYAIGVAISPVAVGTVLLVLTGRAPVVNAMSFAAGWIAGVTACAAVVALLVAGLDLTDARPAWIGASDLVVAGLFLAVAARVWLRPRAHGAPPRLDIVDRATAARSALIGVVLSAANPKVFVLALGAALALTREPSHASLSVAAAAAFIGVSAIGVVLPIVLYAVHPARAAADLARLRGWLAAHERPVLIGLALALATVFIRDGVPTFTA
jgi:threonine/homoserine/homoserine lactone efflux protein